MLPGARSIDCVGRARATVACTASVLMVNDVWEHRQANSQVFVNLTSEQSEKKGVDTT